uniref:Uncharacterized protein n=1 Tax=Anguilla anguilla TaxID=7936 RepID=A0A0E9QYB8_ANGAN
MSETHSCTLCVSKRLREEERMFLHSKYLHFRVLHTETKC